MSFNKKTYIEVNSLISANYPSTKLMIVSKNRSLSSIRQALNDGANLFGENKVQEAELKFEGLREEFSNIDLHLIGPLQTNKVKQAMRVFDVIQSVDREKLVKEIAKQNLAATRTKQFYIQINIGNEDQKSGIDPEKAKDFYNYSISLNLNIVGLMCIPPNNKNPEFFFKKMVKLRDDINSNLLLSMGMSGDFLHALNNQTNIIRIGSKFFNEE